MDLNDITPYVVNEKGEIRYSYFQAQKIKLIEQLAIILKQRLNVNA